MDRKIEFKVGVFIIVTTLLIIFTVGYIIYKKDMFAREYTYTLKSDTGENITRGMPVLFLGFEIGKVSSIKLDEKENAVLVEIKIPEKNNNALRLSSRFKLDTPLLGSSRIIVETPNLDAEPLPEEGFSRLSYNDDINELINRGRVIADKVSKLMEALTTAINKVSKVSENTIVFQENLNRTIVNIEKLTSQYSEKESFVELLTGRKESAENIHKFTQNLNEISDRANEMLKKFDSLAEKTDNSIYGSEGIFPLLKELLRDLASTLDNFNKVSIETSDAAEDLRVLRDNVDETVNSIRSLVDSLDQLIPFRDESGIELP